MNFGMNGERGKVINKKLKYYLFCLYCFCYLSVVGNEKCYLKGIILFE